MIPNEALNKAAFPIARALAPDEYEEGLFQYDPAYHPTQRDFARERLTLLVSALYGFWGTPLARKFFGDLVQRQGDFQNKELWLAVAHGEPLSGYFMTFDDTEAQAHMRSIIKERNPWMEGNGRNGGATGIRFEPEINHIKIIDCAATPRQSIASLAYERIPFINEVDTNSKNISSLGFPNPFRSMFKGKADEKLFENIKACIKSPAFWRAWEENRRAKVIIIRALSQKQSLKEDTPGEGAGVTKRARSIDNNCVLLNLPSIEKWSDLSLGDATALEIYISRKDRKGRNYSFVELHLGDKRRNSAKEPSKTWHAIRYYAFGVGKKHDFKKTDLLRANQALSRFFPSLNNIGNPFPISKSGLQILKQDALSRQTTHYDDDFGGKSESECRDEADEMQYGI